MSTLAERVKALADKFASPATSTIAPADRAKYAAIANDLRALLDDPEPAGGNDIAAKIERSSLGTPEAKALRATVSDQQVARVVARAKELEREPATSDDVEALAEVLRRADDDALVRTNFEQIVASYDEVARAVIASDWLADRLATARREATDAALGPVEALIPGECWLFRGSDLPCTHFVGATFGSGGEFTAEMCCLPCRLRAAIAQGRDAAKETR